MQRCILEEYRFWVPKTSKFHPRLLRGLSQSFESVCTNSGAENSLLLGYLHTNLYDRKRPQRGTEDNQLPCMPDEHDVKINESCDFW